MANLPSIYKSIQAPAGANPQDLQSTQDQMAITYGPQENSINTAINQINQYLQQDIAAQQQYGQVADQKIAEVGSQLAGQLQGNVGAIGNIYQSGQSQVGSVYDQAIAATQGAGSSIRDRLSQSAAALGQTQALKADPYGADPISRLMAQQASTETSLNKSKANSQASLAQLGASLQGIAQKAVGDSERNYAQKRSDVATQVLQTIGKLQVGANQGIMEQLQKFSDLAETEGPAFRQLLNQTTSARTKTEQAAAQQALENFVKMSELDIKQQTAAEKNDPNSLDNLIKQTTLQKNLNSLDDSNTYTDAAAGNENLMEWLNDLRVNKGALTGRQYAGIQNFINQNAGSASALNQDPYSYLVNQAQSLAGQGGLVQTPRGPGATGTEANYQVPLDVLLQALGKRYQGTASTASKIGTKVK